MKKQDAGRKNLSDLAPKFAELNDDVLFGEVWSRTDKLSLKERSIVTVTCLISRGIIDNSLKSHLLNAKNNGVSKEEMVELITQLAFYAGWPLAWAAFPLIRETYKDEKTSFEPMFGLGVKNDAYKDYFIGQSYINPVVTEGIKIFNVTFEPGCRNNYHIHHAKSGGGQILLAVDGIGYYQEAGKEAIILRPGDSVFIKPNVKHWHGATKNSYFSHLAIDVPGEDTSNEWLEPVTDEEYNKLPKE